jgi:hypothetical protein
MAEPLTAQLKFGQWAKIWSSRVLPGASAVLKTLCRV